MFASLQAKLIVIAIIGTIIAGLVFTIKYQHSENIKLNKEVAVDKVVNKELTNTVETDTKVNKINNDINLQLDTDIKKTVVDQDNIKNDMDSKVKAIENKYSSIKVDTVKNKSTSNTTANLINPNIKQVISSVEEQKVREISEVRIDGLWLAFCNASPDNQQCIQ